jgi:stage II sporulation protein D (peptidoglycan lytic transglycosylase)
LAPPEENSWRDSFALEMGRRRTPMPITVLGAVVAAACTHVAESTPSSTPPFSTSTDAPGTCTHVAPPSESAGEPRVDVALFEGAAAVDLGSSGALCVFDARGGVVVELAERTAARAYAEREHVRLRTAEASFAPARVLELTSAGTIRVNDREYRGSVRIIATPAGLLVVNRLGIEDYVGGVVNAELGRRPPGERAALEAQAIVSRTFALRKLGRRDRDFDLSSTTADQVYGGALSETPAGRAAVEATRGLVITYDDEPIEAFFHSTCGGRTASGGEVFTHGDLPYLRSAVDRSAEHASYCAISPRYRWREEWTADELESRFRPTLGSASGHVRDVVVTDRSASGRVESIEIRSGENGTHLHGRAIREVFRPEGAPLLRSTAFRVRTTRAGDRLVRLVLHGRGNGHGVGMCQWGAIGRARAGQTAEEIVSAYFPGTTLTRRW